MIQAERINTMVTYPEQTRCFCGETAHFKYKTVANRYEDRVIHVTDVPVYECSSLHDKMARITRVNLKKVLKNAYESKETIVKYEE